ncbi:uncharacterized protein Tes isoform X1 [Temnothorax nylanderi]|uniref:uncharacterized protein Tes isoform X1 n=2 Tax=Temnothorax nylanderi TaxID=102681 RepID=UPI003A8598BB
MEEDMTNRPKWLLELESRKRKPRLAHEAGAGAPCTNCNSACPGLDLHFWRKICKNCKCARDDHDVDDDEFPQFDLLLGPSLGKFKKKSMRLQVNNKKQNDGETTFEWVPPDTTRELAVDYMKALPAEKLPIKGSVGAVLRRQLLQKQLPLHDIDHKVCDELSEQERKQFEKYLENIKRYVGQGKVTKMFGARPFDRSLMTPVNATDMQKCSPQHKPHVSSTGVQLRTPSSFAVKGPYARHPYEAQNKRDAATVINNNEVSSTKEYNYTLDNVSASGSIARSQPIEGKLTRENFQRARDTASVKGINEKGIDGKMVNSSILTHLAEQEIVVSARERHAFGNYISHGGDAFEGHEETRYLNDTASCIAHPEDAHNDKTAFIAESMLADALLPPSAIHANDIIGSTLDEKGLTFIREKLADKYNVAENPVAMRAVSKSLRPLDTSNTSYPPRRGGAKENDTPAGIGRYAERTENIIAAAKNPLETAEIITPLEAERKMYKPLSEVIESTIVPVSLDVNERKRCGGSLSNSKVANNDSLVTDTTKASITESIMDPLSSKRISTDPTFPTSNLSTQAPDSQKPVDAKSNPLQVELSSGGILLQPSVIHSEQLQNQVFPHIVGNLNEQCVQYTQLADRLKDSIESLKLDSTRVHECEKCHEDIRVGDVVVIAEKANNASWHPGCFVCSVCNELLVDLVYFYYKNKLYCGRDLAAFLGIPRCFACDELIFVREYTVAEGHNYHVKHFCCWDCDVPLAGQQYITENDRPLCLPCYQKSYAKTCAACNVVIAADQQGVAIKNLNFHATEVCFCCYSCKRNLLNGRMAIKKDKLFCSKECIAKFFN